MENVIGKRIHVDINGLAHAHARQLRFLEIRRHPEVLRDDGQQRLADLKVLTRFNIFSRDPAGHRRLDDRVGQIQHCRIQLRLRQTDLSLREARPGLGGGNLPFGGLGRREHTLGVGDLRLCFAYARRRRPNAFLGGEQLSPRRVVRGT